MKVIAAVVLYLCGAIQLGLGLVAGRLRIYAIEAPFWHDLGLTEEHSRVFQKYVGMLKDQWSVLTWVGLSTLLATTILLITTRGKAVVIPVRAVSSDPKY